MFPIPFPPFFSEAADLPGSPLYKTKSPVSGCKNGEIQSIDGYRIIQVHSRPGLGPMLRAM